MSNDHVESVCKLGQAESCCSYLLMGPNGWACAKSTGNEGFRRTLSMRREAGTIKAMGDNCDGFELPAPSGGAA